MVQLFARATLVRPTIATALRVMKALGPRIRMKVARIYLAITRFQSTLVKRIEATSVVC